MNYLYPHVFSQKFSTQGAKCCAVLCAIIDLHIKIKIRTKKIFLISLRAFIYRGVHFVVLHIISNAMRARRKGNGGTVER